MYRRRSELIGAIAARLAGLTDAELRAVPYDRSIFCDWYAFVRDDAIGLSDVSIMRVDSECEVIDTDECPEGHTHLLSFIYCLNRFGRRGEDFLAHEAPYQEAWAALNRSEMLKFLVEFVVAHDPVQLVAENLTYLDDPA